jgi:hypothetical protein
MHNSNLLKLFLGCTLLSGCFDNASKNNASNQVFDSNPSISNSQAADGLPKPHVFADAQTLLGAAVYDEWSPYYHFKSSYELFPKTIYFIPKQKDIEFNLHSKMESNPSPCVIKSLDSGQRSQCDIHMIVDRVENDYDYKLEALRELVASKGLKLEPMKKVLTPRQVVDYSFGYRMDFMPIQCEFDNDVDNLHELRLHEDIAEYKGDPISYCRLHHDGSRLSAIVPSGFKVKPNDDKPNQTTYTYIYPYDKTPGYFNSDTKKIVGYPHYIFRFVQFLTHNKDLYRVFYTRSFYKFNDEFLQGKTDKVVHLNYRGAASDTLATITKKLEAHSYIDFDGVQLSLAQLRTLNFLDTQLDPLLTRYAKSIQALSSGNNEQGMIECDKNQRTNSQNAINAEAQCAIKFVPAKYQQIVIDTSQPEQVHQLTVMKDGKPAKHYAVAPES